MGLNYEKVNKITLIKGATGLGKSTAYTDLLTVDNEWQDNKIIALPTNKAKRHIFNTINEKMQKSNNNNRFMITPDFEGLSPTLYNKVMKLQNIGAYEQLKNYIAEYVSKNAGDEKQAKNVLILNNYLIGNENVKDFENGIVTTHTRACFLTPKVYNCHNIIYDEDILNEAIKIIEIPIKNIEQTLPHLKESKEIIQKKLEIAQQSKYREIIPVESIIWNQDKIEAEIKESKHIHCNINNILRCTAVARNNPNFSKTLNPNGKDEKDTLCMLIENSLPYRNSIVLSATADFQLYQDYFVKKLGRKLFCKEAPKVENSGTIIQHYSYTYSKDCLNRNPDIIQEIREKHPHDLIILSKDFIDKDRKYNGFEIETGKLESLDDLNGQNFVVVGLPNRGELYHKMLEYAIYGVIHNEVSMRNAWDENDFGKFQFFNYPREYQNLRRIRFWDCQETLNQIVGRARLILPENRFTEVHVYAKYPLEGAIYVP